MLQIVNGLLGWICIISMIYLCFCTSSIRKCIDEEKIRQEKDIANIYKSLIPPERVLTELGLKKLNTAKITLLVMLSSMLTLIILWAVRP